MQQVVVQVSRDRQSSQPFDDNVEFREQIPETTFYIVNAMMIGGNFFSRRIMRKNC